MTLEEFLTWEDGTDTRYELIRGKPVAKAIQPAPHGMMVANLCAVMEFGLPTRHDYVSLPYFGVGSPTDRQTFYLADFVVMPGPIKPDRQLADNPIVLVEVISDSTAEADRGYKLLDYQQIPSVQEILLIESRCPLVELHRRKRDGWERIKVRDPQAELRLASLPLTIAMAEIYDHPIFFPDRAG